MKINFLPKLQMVIDPGTAAIVGAGISGAVQGGNAISQGKLNRKNRAWQEKMYARQRQDVISDWNMQNEYNSPEAQMRRYKEAGLNPNLVYGQSNESPQVKSASVDNPNTAPVRVDPSFIGEGINQYMNVMQAKQNLANMEKQHEVMQSVIELNKNKALTELIRPDYMQTLIDSTGSKTDLNKQELSQKSELFPSQLSVQQLLVGKIKQEIATSLSSENKNKAQIATENKLREVKFNLLQANIEYTKAKKDGTYQQIKESEQKVLNLKKEYNAVEVKLGLLGNYGFKMKEGQNLRDMIKEIRDSY